MAGRGLAALCALIATWPSLGAAPKAEVDQRAEAVSVPDLDAELGLVHGKISLCGYTGETEGWEASGLGPLRMNDGPQGFRGKPGTSTAWPSGLALAATFDPELAYSVAKSQADEFASKGANVVLGPGLNVLRVPLNGRTFEYLSGEEPLLGAKLGAAVVRGTQQREGMIATAKHFALNNQETERMSIDVAVDDVTLHELYLMPFRAVVKAGVYSIMCSYNKFRGDHACESRELLTSILRDQWGFEGFVMSDWLATHSTRKAAMAGLDQEMPLGLYFGPKMRLAVLLDHELRKRVSVMAGRIRSVMAKVGTAERNDCPIATNSSSHESVALAMSSATAGTVLLKNEDATLPLGLTVGLRIAVVGAAASDPEIVAGNGSGHVNGGDKVVTALAGIRALLSREQQANAVVLHSPGHEDPHFAATVNGSDVVVVVLATNSGEGSDRKSLDLDGNAEELVAAAASHACATCPVVVVCVAPGPFVLPWAESADAILAMFMPGEQFGTALAHVVFGRAEPQGRLPLTLPRRGSEITFRPEQYPGVGGLANYSEGLLVGYRWYDHHEVEPHFPFGFGLSFASFEYEHLQAEFLQESRGWNVTVTVRNVANVGGHEIVQVYLVRACEGARTASPSGTVRPPKRLVGFQKVRVGSMASKSVSVMVGFDAVAEYRPQLKRLDWPSKGCKLELHIGRSSRDLRLATPLPNWTGLPSLSEF